MFSNIIANPPLAWAKLAATIADMAATEPPERSIPAVMMTWVTPTAMIPMIETCRMITGRRFMLKRKLCPISIQPRISNVSATAIRTRKMLASAGIFLMPNTASAPLRCNSRFRRHWSEPR